MAISRRAFVGYGALGILTFSMGAGLLMWRGYEEGSKSAIEGLPGWMSVSMVKAAIEARDEYGYPVPGNLAQLILENGADGSAPGRECHNYGGVKYFGSYGKDGTLSGSTYGGLITGYKSYDTQECDENGNYYTLYGEHFAVFASDEAFMEYRHKYLLQQDNYTRVADYQLAIETDDSILFVRALGEGGYYTDSQDTYAAGCRSIIDRYELDRFDQMTVSQLNELAYSSGITGTSAQSLTGVTDKQRRVVSASERTWGTQGWCAAWASDVIKNAGFARPGGNACDMYDWWCTSSNLDELKVGMLIAVKHSPYGSDGWKYGHVGIYVGNDTVRHQAVTRTDTNLNDWIEEYGTYSTPRWGWASGNDLSKE